LPYGLLWFAGSTGGLRLPKELQYLRTATWSWAIYDGEVVLPSGTRIKSFEIECLGVKSTSDQVKISGPCMITILAQVKVIQGLCNRTVSRSISRNPSWESYSRQISSPTEIYGGIYLDDEIRVPNELYDSFSFLKVAELLPDPTGRFSWGGFVIVLEEAGYPGMYRRIGGGRCLSFNVV
jgi:hypothetical protein